MPMELSQRASHPGCARPSDVALAGLPAGADVCKRPRAPSTLRPWLLRLAHGVCMLVVVGLALAAVAYLAHRIETAWLFT